MKMKMLVIGANGGIGSKVVKHALQSGFDVTAVIRPNSRPVEDDIPVIEAELHQLDVMKKAISQVDVVVSAIGPALDMSRKRKGTPIADATKNVMNLMETLGKKRFITIGTPTLSAKEDKKNVTTILPKVLAKISYPNAFREMKMLEELISKSKLDWTVIRYINPNLKGSGNGYDYTFGDKSGKLSVSRDNIAKFIVEVSADDAFIKKMPIIYNK